jgi:hypothetical protein
VIYDPTSRSVNAAADAVAQQRRAAAGFQASVLDTAGTPTLGRAVLTGR